MRLLWAGIGKLWGRASLWRWSVVPTSLAAISPWAASRLAAEFIRGLRST
jgi:hypothetical protein